MDQEKEKRRTKESMEVKGKKIPNIMVTHGGIHHADEVFAYATLHLINPRIDLIRTNQVEEWHRSMEASGQAIIVDIGGGQFDHHTIESQEFRDPVKQINPFASFGKVWREYGTCLVSEKEATIIDNAIVIPTDYSDCNGGLWHGVHNYLSEAISSFNPTWEEAGSDEDRVAAFKTAALFAEQILRRMIAKARAIVHAEAIVESALASEHTRGKHFIVLPKYVNYSSKLQSSLDDEITWVIYPSIRGGYCIFSAVYRGKNADLINDEIAEKMEADEDVTFVHPGRFIASTTTLEVAIKWANVLSDAFDARQDRFFVELKESLAK